MSGRRYDESAELNTAGRGEPKEMVPKEEESTVPGAPATSGISSSQERRQPSTKMPAAVPAMEESLTPCSASGREVESSSSAENLAKPATSPIVGVAVGIYLEQAHVASFK